MLFRVEDFSNLHPLKFLSVVDEQKLEKHLEQLIADSLFGVLFETGQLMPFFRERKWQPEADIYALDHRGDVHIFELKSQTAGRDAVQQLLRYAEDAGAWTCAELENKYQSYKGEQRDLRDDHREAFSLSRPLLEESFNRTQHLRIIANAADQELVKSVEFWQGKRLDIEFLPYRLYRLNSELYLEFFAKPHDIHANPAHIKGVLFDTNRSYDTEESGTLKHMFDNRRASAFGTSMDMVRRLNTKDIVFFYHVGVGVVAGAEVIGSPKKAPPEELYCDVRFLTPLPDVNTGRLRAISARRLSELLGGKKFYWATTVKAPYLTPDESEKLLAELLRISSEK